MSINIQVTNEQFWDLYKDSEFIRGMSFSAVDGVLDYLSELSEDNTEIPDWTATFMNAVEYTEEEFLKEFTKILDQHDIDACAGNPDELIDCIREVTDNYVRKIWGYSKDTYVVISE